jgi:hypothetical protein
MRKLLLAATAAAALAGAASSADAAITMAYNVQNQLYGLDSGVML